jgi:hypothetical protein
MRNVVAIIGGYVVWTVVWLGGNAGIKGSMPSRYDADGFSLDTTVLGLALVLSVVCSVLSGWVAARLAHKPRGAAMILGGLLLATGLMVQISAWSKMPVWYHLIFLVLLYPMTMFGATRGMSGRTVASASTGGA